MEYKLREHDKNSLVFTRIHTLKRMISGAILERANNGAEEFTVDYRVFHGFSEEDQQEREKKRRIQEIERTKRK